ncbi:3-deoxy-manno-octulosonate cytidylyltransferase [Thermodesulfobacteriota bacterium]
MNVVGIIPARMASSRFPGKPLKPILGIPMVEHVYLRSAMSRTLDDLFVATCDDEIRDHIADMGGNVIMTSEAHERASARTAEALEHIERRNGKIVEIVVMIQGDEPMLRPEMIDEAIAPLLLDKAVLVSNLMAPLKSAEEHDDRNEIKVVVDRDNFALYFSREPIPTRSRIGEKAVLRKQVCVIPFRREFLLQYNNLAPTPLEIAESIDMMRVLEHGYRVKMVPTSFDIYSVDTEEDRQRVEALMGNDGLVGQYPTLGMNCSPPNESPH